MKEVINMSNNDQEFLVQKIRTQYTEKQHTELDALKELDAKVKRPANVFAYTYGSVSAVVMGAGMSLVMTCYNTADYAREAILSCLKQNYAGPLQLVLVNDASTDNTIAIIKDTVANYGGESDIEIVDLPQNTGVSGATDAGWARTKYDCQNRS